MNSEKPSSHSFIFRNRDWKHFLHTFVICMYTLMSSSIVLSLHRGLTIEWWQISYQFKFYPNCWSFSCIEHFVADSSFICKKKNNLKKDNSWKSSQTANLYALIFPLADLASVNMMGLEISGHQIKLHLTYST